MNSYRHSGRASNRRGNFSQRGGHARPFSRGAQRGKRNPGADIEISRFINKSVQAEDIEVYMPVHQFTDFDIDPRIKENILQKGYRTPTPIQDQVIPHILRGKDVVGIANTGTGKTGAFLIPLLDKVVKSRDERVLIIVPTRELAQQIDQEFKGFAEGSGFLSVSAVGGVNINGQIRGLRADPYFVIGTPGRLKDLMDRKALDVSKFKTVVLDEADRMLDMGFIRDMRFILSRMHGDRHTLFFSATLSSDIEKLIGEFLKDPVRVSVKKGDTASSIEQDVVYLRGKNKVEVLHDLLVRPEFEKVLVFGRTKHGVERLSKELAQRGFKAASIHGNKSQSHRQRSLSAFKNSDVVILVATDVAARGIDISGVSHVINYELPTTYEDYVHRIGRTGRAGKRGVALTFVE